MPYNRYSLENITTEIHQFAKSVYLKTCMYAAHCRMLLFTRHVFYSVQCWVYHTVHHREMRHNSDDIMWYHGCGDGATESDECLFTSHLLDLLTYDVCKLFPLRIMQSIYLMGASMCQYVRTYKNMLSSQCTTNCTFICLFPKKLHQTFCCTGLYYVHNVAQCYPNQLGEVVLV